MSASETDASTLAASFSIEFEADNGTVPPPFRRSLRIDIDAEGRGRVTRQIGYNVGDAANRIEIDFAPASEALSALARLIDRLNVFEHNWARAEDTPTGGPLTYLSIQRGATRVRIPPYPLDALRAAADSLRSAVRELLPADAIARYRAWEQAHGGEE